jgi:hypothetical protein
VGPATEPVAVLDRVEVMIERIRMAEISPTHSLRLVSVVIENQQSYNPGTRD